MDNAGTPEITDLHVGTKLDFGSGIQCLASRMVQIDGGLISLPLALSTQDN